MSDRQEIVSEIGSTAQLCPWCGVTHKIGKNTLCPITGRIEELEARLEAVKRYANRCAILRTEPTTAGLRKALQQGDDE